MSQPSARLPLPAASLQHAFLSILPRVRAHGLVAFRDYRPERRDEAIAEMVALAWHWFVRLAQRGKDATQFSSPLAVYAACAVRAGRRLCGQDRAKDVLSPRAQRLRHFVVNSLPDQSTLAGNCYDEALQDNTQTPVPDQVAFRHDFPAWQRTLPERDRRLLCELMRGERSCDAADKLGMSRARVSQKRRLFRDDWRRFCGERVINTRAAVAR